MIEEVRFVLEKHQSPERVSLIMGALSLFYEYDYTAHEFELINSINSEDLIAGDGVVLAINNIVETAANEIIKAHEIVLNVETSLRNKINILDGLKTLETFTDSDAVLNAIDEDYEDPNQILANLLALVTDREWGDYADVLHNVPNALINRINDIHVKLKEGQEIEDDIVEEGLQCKDLECEALRNRVKDYMKRNSGEEKLLIETMVSEGYRVGLDFDYMINETAETLESFYPKNPQAAAKNIMSLALASPISVSDLKNEIGERLENLYDDMTFITNVDIALTEEMKKVVAYG